MTVAQYCAKVRALARDPLAVITLTSRPNDIPWVARCTWGTPSEPGTVAEGRGYSIAGALDNLVEVVERMRVASFEQQ